MKTNKSSTLFYCNKSDTIRQAPQNYLIAHRTYNSWICDPDLASDKILASAVFLALFDYDLKYGKPEIIIQSVNNTLTSL